MEPVEVALVGRHLGVVLPRLGHHHHHRVRQRPAAELEQLEHLVEARRVRDVLGAHRHRALEVAGEQVGGEQRLAGPHAVAVAADRVDLAVVRHHPVRVGQRPAREGVGGEPAVHHGDGADQALVAQVGEEHRQLVGGQHALVGHRAAGERRDVEPAPLLGGLALRALAHDPGEAVELDPGDLPVGGGDDDLREVRHRAACDRPDVGALGVHRDLAPAEDVEALLGDDALEQRDRLGAVVGVGGQEGEAGGVREDRRAAVGRRPGLGQREVDRGPQQRVGHLEHDPGAVPAGRLAAGGTTVVEVVQDDQGVAHDRVAGHAAGVGDGADPAGVVLVRGVVEPLRARGRAGLRHRHLVPPRRRAGGGDPGTTVAQDG